MIITEVDLKDITNDFSDVIGHGGFGVVYKERYRHVDVAVKMLNKVMSRLLIIISVYFTYKWFIVIERIDDNITF